MQMNSLQSIFGNWTFSWPHPVPCSERKYSKKIYAPKYVYINPSQPPWFLKRRMFNLNRGINHSWIDINHYINHYIPIKISQEITKNHDFWGLENHGKHTNKLPWPLAFRPLAPSLAVSPHLTLLLRQRAQLQLGVAVVTWRGKPCPTSNVQRGPLKALVLKPHFTSNGG